VLYATLGSKVMEMAPLILSQAAEMGLAAGGKMKQKIYPDPHGIDTWDQDNYGRVFVHIVNSLMYREITGMEPPLTPVSAKTYTQYSLPWFDLYNEKMGAITTPEGFEQIKTVKEIDKGKGFTPQQDDESIEISEENIIKYKIGSDEPVDDGDW
jgi:hypothetical protein